ncbi:MAG: ABC transporter substrate-binding protein [Pseudonocardiaceae bacterium]
MARWRSLLIAGVLIAAGCVASGCAGAPEPVAGDDLVWATGEITASGPADVAAMWNRLHPRGPRVRVEALPQSPDDQRQLLAVELNAGIDEFDILDLDLIWTGEFAENGWLVDLEDLRTEIEEVSLPGPVQSAIWDGRLWAAPFTTDAGLLYYRTDLVDKPPATWQQLMDLGLRIGEAEGIAPFVADGAQYEGMVVQYLEYFWGAGGDVFDSDCTAVMFQEEPALRAAEFMQTAFRNGFYAPGFDTMTLNGAEDVFRSGQAVFLRGWPYMYRQVNDPDSGSRVAGKVGIAPLPTFDGKGTATALGGHNLAVSRFSRNVDAATEFVRFVSTSPQVQRHLAERHSLAPTMASVYDDLAGDPLMKQLARVLPQANTRPSTPQWTTISEEVQQQIFAAYTGDKDPEAAVDALRQFLVSTDTTC